uniref:Uncharacterized protein n=1 Tax=Borely moumouvirus TaxID=2712067 RepID=A0A6G6AEA1_9VIRU
MIILINLNGFKYISTKKKIDLSKYKHKEYLPDGRIKVKRHNTYGTRCCRQCSDPDCEHGELGYISEQDEINNYFFVTLPDKNITLNYIVLNQT